MKNAAQVAQKWAQNLAASGTAVQQGVAAVTVNPAEQAAAQADVAVQNYTAAKGKMVAGLQRSTLQGWQSAMNQKGIPRMQQGATTAVPKVQAFMQQLLPAVAAAKATLPPRGTLQQNLQRANAFATAMSQFKRTS
jgi:hypothetical protein